MPRWYGLGITDSMALTIEVHEAALSFLRALKLLKSSIAVRALSDNSNLSFVWSPTQFGFNGCCSIRDSRPGWQIFECPLPVIRPGEYDDIFSDTMPVRLTLAMLVKAFLWFEGCTGVDVPQLMIIDGMNVERSLHGGSISVSLGQTTIKWLAKQPENSSLEKVKETMLAVDRYMRPDRMFPQDPRQFDVWCRQPKWINFTIPGNACGLDPENYHNLSLNAGYALHAHNVDSGLQQLTLLAGVAKLYELVQEDSDPQVKA